MSTTQPRLPAPQITFHEPTPPRIVPRAAEPSSRTRRLVGGCQGSELSFLIPNARSCSAISNAGGLCVHGAKRSWYKCTAWTGPCAVQLCDKSRICTLGAVCKRKEHTALSVMSGIAPKPRSSKACCGGIRPRLSFVSAQPPKSRYRRAPLRIHGAFEKMKHKSSGDTGVGNNSVPWIASSVR